jgi:hypothetical protein
MNYGLSLLMISTLLASCSQRHEEQSEAPFSVHSVFRDRLTVNVNCAGSDFVIAPDCRIRLT